MQDHCSDVLFLGQEPGHKKPNCPYLQGGGGGGRRGGGVNNNQSGEKNPATMCLVRTT
jgi:hypothetical protein